MGWLSRKFASATLANEAAEARRALPATNEADSDDEDGHQAKTLLTGLHHNRHNNASKGQPCLKSREPALDNAVSVSERKNARAENCAMVQTLKNSCKLSSKAVEKAMLSTDRLDYVPQQKASMETMLSIAYSDRPQSLPGHPGAAISAPSMHAHSLELLADHLTPGARALDIGSGSGYVSACMARMVGPTGMVIGIDHLKPLVELGLSNVRKSDADLLDGPLAILHGDGWKGCPEGGPFDCIHVGASVENVPDTLLMQLRPGGRMIIPIGSHSAHFYQIDRTLTGEYKKKKLMSTRSCPLVKMEVPPACQRNAAQAGLSESTSALGKEAILPVRMREGPEGSMSERPFASPVFLPPSESNSSCGSSSSSVFSL